MPLTLLAKKDIICHQDSCLSLTMSKINDISLYRSIQSILSTMYYPVPFPHLNELTLSVKAGSPLSFAAQEWGVQGSFSKTACLAGQCCCDKMWEIVIVQFIVIIIPVVISYSPFCNSKLPFTFKAPHCGLCLFERCLHELELYRFLGPGCARGSHDQLSAAYLQMLHYW